MYDDNEAEAEAARLGHIIKELSETPLRNSPDNRARLNQATGALQRIVDTLEGRD